MPQRNDLPARADREDVLGAIEEWKRSIWPNLLLDEFTRLTDKIVAWCDRHAPHIDVGALTHFKEIVLQGIRNARAQSRPWNPTSEEQLAAAKADGECNRIKNWLSTTPTKRRGRRPATDSRDDQRIVNAWDTGNFRTYADLGRELHLTTSEVRKAIDRHRKRRN